MRVSPESTDFPGWTLAYRALQVVWRNPPDPLDTDLAVFDLAEPAAPLPGHAHRLGPLLEGQGSKTITPSDSPSRSPTCAARIPSWGRGSQLAWPMKHCRGFRVPGPPGEASQMDVGTDSISPFGSLGVRYREINTNGIFHTIWCD
jgi:hypothetical protein